MRVKENKREDCGKYESHRIQLTSDLTTPQDLKVTNLGKMDSGISPKITPPSFLRTDSGEDEVSLRFEK